MPHKVVAPFAFFRSHSNPFDLQESKKPSRRSSNSRPAPSERSNSSSTSSLAVSEEVPKIFRMPDTHKRLSFPSIMHSPKSSSKSIPQVQSSKLEFVIESPPLVFYGPASSSTGALLSGQLKLNVHDEFMAIDSFTMRLALEVTRKKPFHAHCPECAHQSTDLTTWSFLQGPATLRKGMLDRQQPIGHS